MDNTLKSLAERLPHVKGLQCVLCGTIYTLDEVTYTCPTCGPVGTLDVLYQEDAQRFETNERPINFWQQRDLLPLSAEPPAELAGLGHTPLVRAEALAHVAQALGVGELWIKNDGLNLTGSLKDRASAMVVAHAIQNLGRTTIATASTGNAAAALAGICAALPSAEAVIFVPATAPVAKIAQILVFGAKIVLIDGPYDTAFDLCGEACAEFGWYNRSTGINPFTTEGKKTVAFEIAAQMNWDVPDVVIVSVGDGSIIGGVHKGFKEMAARGWIAKVPRLIGVQSSVSDALVYAWENNLTAPAMTPHRAETIADSISSELPRDRAKALRAVHESGGVFMRIDDADILKAIPAMARQTGVFAEPAAAITFAAIKPALDHGFIQPTDRVLLVATGNGMKDVKSAMASVADAQPPITAPHLAAIRNQINQWETT